AADRVEGVAEEVAGPGQGAEQVAQHREAAALEAREVNRRAVRLVDAPLDLGRFEVRVDLDVEPDELAGAFQVGEAVSKVAVAHARSAVPGGVVGKVRGYYRPQRRVVVPFPELSPFAPRKGALSLRERRQSVPLTGGAARQTAVNGQESDMPLS